MIKLILDKDTVKAYMIVILIVSLLVGAISIILLQPYFEARAFNKFSVGPKATYWDAVFADLRVTAR